MKYCAFLRGVNVKGTSMKMAEVIKVFSDAGMKDVSTVLASGNILFSSDKKPSELKIILEKAMSHYFEYEAFLFLKNQDEIAEILNNNPFSKADDLHIYVFVGTEGSENILLEEFTNAKKQKKKELKLLQTPFTGRSLKEIRWIPASEKF